MRLTPTRFARTRSFARACTTSVTSVSAGPPCGGLYLKPPSRGGLCDGVMTMPSARRSPALRPRLCTRIARDSAGVGVKPATPVSASTGAISVSTPLAASTSSAVCCAGSDAACVSMPRNSGARDAALRAVLSQIACVMARMCASLKAPSSAAPRWPLVPNATSWLGSFTSWRARRVRGTQLGDVDQDFGRGELSCEGRR